MPIVDISYIEESYDWMRPVFIVGFPGSGTTLLYRILYRHTSFNPRLPSASEDYNAMVETQFYRRFFRHARDLWESDKERSLKTWFADDQAAFSHFLLDTFRAFHLRAAAARNVHRILEKTPDHVLLCPFMVHAFADARILCIQRDPADTLASFRRRRKIQSGSEGAWLVIAKHTDSFIQSWNTRATAWHRFIDEFPEHGKVVSYEKLTGHPKKALDSVLSFIGVEPQDHLLQGPPPEADAQASDHYDSHVPVCNTGVWHEFVRPKEAELVRAHCLSFSPR